MIGKAVIVNAPDFCHEYTPTYIHTHIDQRKNASRRSNRITIIKRWTSVAISAEKRSYANVIILATGAQIRLAYDARYFSAKDARTDSGIINNPLA